MYKTKIYCVHLLVQLLYIVADSPNQYFSKTPHSRQTQGLTYRLYQTSWLFWYQWLYLQVSCELLNEKRTENVSESRVGSVSRRVLS